MVVSTCLVLRDNVKYLPLTVTLSALFLLTPTTTKTMARKKKRSWKVPKILWKIFKDKARSLATTITCIIPPSPPHPPETFPFTCRCEGRSCLQCFEDPMSFLLRPDDPLDYKKLLNDCFVVVNENAPFLEFYPDQRWSQKEIVGRVIEMLLSQRPKSSNILCSGYNKISNLSQIVELLTSSAWDILLERVGDECMIYLLRHTSIFVPLSNKKYLQVVGSPVNNLSKKLPKNETKPQSGAGKKRKRGYHSKFHSSGEFQRSSNQTAKKCKPFLRPFNWKRDKKRRLLNISECRDEPIVRPISFYENCLPGSLMCASNTNQMTVLCSCYLMLKAPQLVFDSNEINRQSMFYNLESFSSVLPRQHVLNSLVPNFSSSKCLMENIFGLSDANASRQSVPCFHDSSCQLIGSFCLYNSFLKLLKMLIRRTKRCNHLKLLEKHCPLPSLDQNAMGNSSTIVKSNISDKTELKQYCSAVAKENRNTSDIDNAELESTRPYCLQSQVVEFIWAVCRSIVPPELLGTPSNWRLLKRNIFKFIRLRRFEKFLVKQCRYRLKPADFPFLSNNHKAQVPKNGLEQKKFSGESCSVHDIKRKLFFNWIFWFFSSLVVPLVRANFYVTESEHGKHDVFYYRKPVWEKLINHAITCLKDQIYLELDEADVRAIIDKRPFGFSRLRPCPKQNGVRMLANLKTSSRKLEGGSSKYRCSWMRKNSKPRSRKVKSKHVKSVNSVLRGIHAVLKGILLKEPEKLGSSVFDYNNVYAKLCPFLTTLKNASTTMPRIFVVAADVSKAFDSIDQAKLLSMMVDVIVKDRYILQQIRQVSCSNKYLWDRENLMLVDETVNTGCTNLMSSVMFRTLPGILVNQGCSRLLLKEELFNDLHEHIKCNVLQFDKKFYLQRMGIPQGSILSTLLCSLYFGHMERHVIYPYLEKTCHPVAESARYISFDSLDAQNSTADAAIFPPTYLLLRFLDDFLFISTSKEQANGFLSMLRRGFPEYNCYMNEAKFCLNFDIEDHQSGLLSNRVYMVDDGTSFLRWSGLLINSNSLEIQGDYTRYLGNHLSSTITISWRSKPGNYLRRKLCDFTRTRCHAIFFDLSINSVSVVRLNIYQAFLLCAMKFHCLVTELSDFFEPRRRYCLKIILRSFRYMHRMIEKRMGSVHPSSGSCPILKPTPRKEEVEWLGLTAYIEILKRKQTRHRPLLCMLRSKFFGHKITGNESSELRYAVDRSHSSSLWKIKY